MMLHMNTNFQTTHTEPDTTNKMQVFLINVYMMIDKILTNIKYDAFLSETMPKMTKGMRMIQN